MGKLDLFQFQASTSLGIESRALNIKLLHWEHLRRFCDVWGVQAVKLGALGENSKEVMWLRLTKYLYDDCLDPYIFKRISRFLVSMLVTSIQILEVGVHIQVCDNLFLFGERGGCI